MDMDLLLSQIYQADSIQIDTLLDAVFARKRELFPQWDIQYWALPKDDWDQRDQVLSFILEMEKRCRRESQKL